MKVPVADLQSVEGGQEHHEFQVALAPLKLAGEEAAFPGPVRVEADLYSNGREITAQVKAGGRLALACGRCLNPVEVPIETSFTETLRPYPRVPQESGEDEDFTYYHHDVIDLRPLVEEHLLLAVPMKVLCSEDCKGLCPHCGRNLNQGPCGCGPEPADTRLAVLADLLRDRNQLS